ncbi:MAG: porin [Gammaproteobacteria bacterium]|nr:porin [Gammaproteobacteria bacterium]
MGKILLLIAFIAYLPGQVSATDTKVTGFASMVAGAMTAGDQFLADYPNTGVYDKDLSFSPDTTIGVQLKTRLFDDYQFVTQLLSRGANDFETDIDWAYINYTVNSEISLQIGRKRLPLYYYSDFYELGFAYYWIRPPSDNYTWQISNYNGASLFYEPEIGNWDALFNLYLGREDDDNNKLLTFLNNTPYHESWRNIIGFVSELSNDAFETRLTLMSSQLHREVNNVVQSDGVAQMFYGISINMYLGNAVILSEFNRYERAADNVFDSTYMLSFAYRFDKLTPHITYSEFKQQSPGDEYHFTYSLGLRKDLNPSTALKIQFDKTTDDATTANIVGDGELLSVGFDIVF